MEKVMAIHVAEEARHISFAHEYLRKRLPRVNRRQRLLLSVNVPIIMRVLCQAILVPPRSFFPSSASPGDSQRTVLPGAGFADAARHVR